jgi:hypothetical protein
MPAKRRKNTKKGHLSREKKIHTLTPAKRGGETTLAYLAAKLNLNHLEFNLA